MSQSSITKSSVLDLYGQPVNPANPPVGTARLFYNATTDTIYIVDSSGTNLIVGGGGGGVAEAIQSISTSTAVSFSTAFNVLVKATAGAGGITATLPTAVGIGGQIARIMKVDSAAGGVTLATSSSQTMNGGASGSLILTTQWQSISLESDGANWLIVGTAN